jgi:hypothetical protein
MKYDIEYGAWHEVEQDIEYVNFVGDLSDLITLILRMENGEVLFLEVSSVLTGSQSDDA